MEAVGSKNGGSLFWFLVIGGGFGVIDTFLRLLPIAFVANLTILEVNATRGKKVHKIYYFLEKKKMTQL